jgi:SAM-dependent methyltransferase
VYRPPASPPTKPSADPVTVGSVGEAWQALVEAVSGLLDGRERLRALEAGARTRTLFDLPDDAYVVGVDRDLQALEVNARLDQRVLADLANYQPRATGFDLVSCWYVLDGLADPAAVLDRFSQWTRPGGLVVLGLPNPDSPRGAWARLRRWSRPRRSLTAPALRRRFHRHGFTPVFQVFFEDGEQVELRQRLRIGGGWWSAVRGMVWVLSLGRFDVARTDYMAVFRRDQ